MIILSLLHENDLIEVHNNFWDGNETVYFNGKEASKKFSFFGESHRFTVDSRHGEGIDDYRVKIRMRWFGHIAVTIWKNEVCLVGHAEKAPTRVVPNHVSRGETEIPEEFLV